jgi:putative DNA primase/helicase
MPRLAVVDAAAPPPLVADTLPETATHIELAHAQMTELELRHGAPPVAAEGVLWLAEKSGLYAPVSAEQLAVTIGRTFRRHKHARRGSDYKQIAGLVLAMAERADFFASAPRGVVCPNGFWTLEAGKLTRVDLIAEHRQRFALAVDPDFDTFPARFWKYLRAAFDGDDMDAQVDLAAELAGAALLGLALKMMLAALLLGPGASGKSTLLAILENLFPPSFVAAVSPIRWGHEYYLAGLAGKRLNVVGELPEDQPLPAAAFKNVTGGDLLEGRHPTHRPFNFRCEAGHFFSANTLPATMDRTDAFFRRWRVLKFTRAIPPEERDPDLADNIVANELPGVLAWAMKGAERAAQRGRLMTTRTHDDVLARWRVGSNPVLLFLLDLDFVELAADHDERSADVYAAFRRWAQAHGNRPMSQQAFMQLLDDSGGAYAVQRSRTAAGRWIRGLRLVGPTQGAFV